MTIVIVGVGVQGTLVGMRLARTGHNVTLIAHGNRATELRTQGAVILNVITGRSDSLQLPVLERLASDTQADLCFVLVRREQIEEVLADLRAASLIKRIVFMVNHANGSEDLYAALGRNRVVLDTARILRPAYIAPSPASLIGAPSGPHGFPVWIRWSHFFNLIFLFMLIRSGLSILMDHPRLYLNDDCTPGTEWIRFTPLTMPKDRLWTAKDDARYISPAVALPGYPYGQRTSPQICHDERSA
jgi:hypothetical protein